MTDVDEANPTDAQAFVHKWFWHEGENLNTRTDFFLIFQAILFEAFISANDLPFRGLEIGAFGLITSIVWFLVGARNDWHIKYMTAAMECPELVGDKVALLVGAFLSARQEQPRWLRWAHSVSLFSRVIPFACFETWLVLLLQDASPTWLAVGAPLATAVIASGLFWGWPGKKPTELVHTLVGKTAKIDAVPVSERQTSKPAARVAAILLLLIGAAHVARLLFRFTVTVDGVTFPMWASIVAIPVSLWLGLALWREQR